MNISSNNWYRFAVVFALTVSVIVPYKVNAAHTQLIGLDSISAYVESSTFSDRIRRVWVSSRPLLEDNEHGFTEALFFDLRGFTYHPRFMQWSGNARVMLKQRFLSNQSIKSNHDINEYLQEYNVSSTFLKDHPVTLGINATRDISNTDGDFLEAVNVIRTSVSSVLSWRSLGVNQSIRLLRTHYQSEGLIENEENRRSVQYDASSRSAAIYTSAQYQYFDNDFLTTGRSFIGHSARLLSTLRLDKQGRRSITSSLIYIRQKDALVYEYTEAALSAKLPIVKQFEAYSSYSFRKNNINSLTSNVHSAIGTLRHSLYQSLITSIKTQGQFTSFNAGYQRDINPSARLEYRKQTIFGSMNLFYSFGYRRFEDNFNRISQRFIERTFTVSLGTPIFLDDRNIDSNSIKIVNLTRPSIIPQQNLDYTIKLSGRDYEVVILAMSSIINGDDILISYFVTSDESFEFEESTRRYGAGLNFGRLVSLRASYLESDRSLISGTPVSQLEDLNINNIVFSTRYKGLSTDLEYNLRRTTINPFKRRSAQALYSISLTGAINLVFSTAYVVTDFTDDSEQSKTMQAAGSLWYQPRHNIIIESRLNNINRSGRRDDGHDFSLSNQVTLISNQIEIHLQQALYDRNVRVAGSEARNIFRLSIKRTF